MEVTGKLPKVTPSAEDNRTTIEKWRDRFLENARTENISEETRENTDYCSNSS